MSESIFKYPGSKSQLSSWITNHIPAHDTYVDVFGGSGALIANKPESPIEIYNDRDGDLVHFFTTLRDHADELAEWIADTPHSRRLHAEYARDYYNNYRPDDDIERAGQFFYLRYTQWGTKYSGKSGYNGSRKRNIARTMNRAADQLTEWQDRFRDVQIECIDFENVISRYGGEDSFLYCDPPYMDEGDDLYSGSDFDHERFVDALRETDSRWLVSYTRVPEELEEMAECVVSQESRVRMNQGTESGGKVNTEHLVMDYDPSEVSLFSKARQSTLAGCRRP